MYHSALGRSPFELLYGHAPCHFGITDLNVCSVPDLVEWLCHHQDLIVMLQQHMLLAQEQMKS
jgi:hypothetical protein